MLNAPTVTRVPVLEFDWEGNNMEMQYITCPRHPGVKYLTKHPFARTLFFVSPWGTAECACSITDMNVEPDQS
jgi:hypothetical protein